MPKELLQNSWRPGCSFEINCRPSSRDTGGKEGVVTKFGMSASEYRASTWYVVFSASGPFNSAKKRLFSVASIRLSHG